MATASFTLKGGPHDKEKLTLWEPIPPAFLFMTDLSIYVLKFIEQKNRTIRKYEHMERLDYDRYIRSQRRQRETARRRAVSRSLSQFW